MLSVARPICYGEIEKYRLKFHPWTHFVQYEFECHRQKGITCVYDQDYDTEYDIHLCECDKVFAQCVATKSYNEEYYDYVDYFNILDYYYCTCTWYGDCKCVS